MRPTTTVATNTMVEVYDHDGFVAHVPEVDVPHWLQKGFVSEWSGRVQTLEVTHAE